MRKAVHMCALSGSLCGCSGTITTEPRKVTCRACLKKMKPPRTRHRAVHFTGRARTTLCGQAPFRTTTTPQEVTCGNCRKRLENRGLL